MNEKRNKQTNKQTGTPLYAHTNTQTHIRKVERASKKRVKAAKDSGGLKARGRKIENRNVYER